MKIHPKTGAGALLAVAAFVLLLVVLWHWLIVAGVGYAAWRYIAHRAGIRRRRRPKSSWSSLGRTAALMFAAWNSRWLKPTTPVKARVTAKVGAEHDAAFGEFPEGY